MVRQWQELFFENACRASIWKAKPGLRQLAGAYGIKAWRIKRRPRSIGF